MRIIITESQLKRISEATAQSNNIQAIYNSIVNAVSGVGTKKDQLLNSIRSIKNIAEFKALTSMFADKKTGYGSFDEMINKEFDRFDYNYVKNILDYLKNTLGLFVNFNIAKNRMGTIFFNEGFTTKFPWNNSENTNNDSPEFKACSIKWEKELPTAKKYWMDWVNHPSTAQKMIQLHKKNEVFINAVITKYKDVINRLSIHYLNKPEADYFAYVNSKSPTEIFVNCGLLDRDPLGTLVHEIQHLLYYYFPINPTANIGDVFVGPNTKKANPTASLSGTKEIGSGASNIASQSLKSDFPGASNIDVQKSTQYWLKKLKTFSAAGKSEYICQETEKMSNIMSMRKLLGIEPYENISLDMIKPYVFGQNKHTDIDWFLMCWAKNGFNNLQGVLNKVNALAMQNTNQGNQPNMA